MAPICGVDVPATYEEAMSQSDAHLWQEAMDKEIESLKLNETWDEKPLPQGKKAPDVKWVYSVKLDGRYKGSKEIIQEYCDIRDKMVELLAQVSLVVESEEAVKYQKTKGHPNMMGRISTLTRLMIHRFGNTLTPVVEFAQLQTNLHSKNEGNR